MTYSAMTSAQEVNRGTYLIGLVSLVVAMVWAGALPAHAQPANDTVEGSLTIELPFSGGQDTSGATTDEVDASLNSECGWPATDASVWYQFTPDEDLFVEISVDGSGYSAGVMVAVQFDGELFLVSCDEALFAFAGETYQVVIFDTQEDGVGHGGDLVLEVNGEPPGPPPEVDLTIDPMGSFHKDGTATLSGTLTCSGDAEFIDIFGQLGQRVGRFTITGFFGLGGHEHENGNGDGNGEPALTCDGTTQTWSAPVDSETGLFKGGKATVEVDAFACGFFECGGASATQTIRLLRAK